jgi:hypothetical protein
MPVEENSPKLVVQFRDGFKSSVALSEAQIARYTRSPQAPDCARHIDDVLTLAIINDGCCKEHLLFVGKRRICSGDESRQRAERRDD